MTTNSTNSPLSPAGYSTGADGTIHASGRLVVDTGALSIIDRLLPGAGRVVDQLPELELSLLAFDDIDAAIAALPAPTGRYASLRGADPVEELMARVRAAASSVDPARIPEMGKDRIVLGGEGFPYPSPKPGLLSAGAASGPFPDPVGAATGNPQNGDCARVVGILDTSVVVKHPGFASTVTALAANWELPAADLKQAWQGHGTFVTGLVHAEAPKVQILVRAVLGSDAFATAWEAAKGMVELKNADVDVINMSIGCVTGDDQPPFALRRAADKLSDGVVLVAAAGNLDPNAAGPTAPVWPAALPGVLAVGSITDQGVPSPFSPQEIWVDVAAAGENVRSTFATGDVVCELEAGGSRKRHFWGTAIWSGTSFAAANVTGRLARLSCETGDTVRELAEKLRTGQLPDPVVRQP
jgi:membrane-anchored mycosin MYCP